MSGFDCCARQGGHDVPDPFDVALGGAIRENRRLRGQFAELQAVIAEAKAMAPISASGTFDILYAVPSDVLAARDAQVRIEQREKDAQIAENRAQFEAPNARMAVEFVAKAIRAAAVRGTGTPTGDN